MSVERHYCKKLLHTRLNKNTDTDVFQYENSNKYLLISAKLSNVAIKFALIEYTKANAVQQVANDHWLNSTIQIFISICSIHVFHQPSSFDTQAKYMKKKVLIVGIQRLSKYLKYSQGFMFYCTSLQLLCDYKSQKASAATATQEIMQNTFFNKGCKWENLTLKVLQTLFLPR